MPFVIERFICDAAREAANAPPLHANAMPPWRESDAGSNADGDSEESVTIANPAAGTWAVLVDGFAVPAGTTTYKYVDVFANAAFGSVSVTDANALRPAGSTWTVPGSVTANAAPAAGRVLLGAVQVRTDTNILIGSGDVIVQSVTP